ncbi:ABC transporter permease [Gorillibacterium sp. CAU 1737]|uniref:ABC transporter permease n=1 Tax=Gorillibacterium sp. CAU 1737 TaxID=3140362 RepID=UPI003260D6BB
MSTTRSKGGFLTKSSFIKSLAISLLAQVLIMLVVLYPRQLNTSIQGYELVVSGTSFNISSYADSVTSFWRNAWEMKSLGITRYGTTVEHDVANAMGRSLSVIAGAFVLSAVFGIGKGMIDHRTSRKQKSGWGSASSMILQSMPDFLAILLIEWFVINYTPIRFFGHVGLAGYLLPVLLVSIFPILYIARVTHAALGANDGKMYITVARAKGLSEGHIFRRHIFRNAMTAIASHLSPLFVYLLSNLLMVEYMMNYPGAAKRLYLAFDYSKSFGVGARYEPGVILETAFCFMILILLVQWLALVIRFRLDPRPEGGEQE